MDQVNFRIKYMRFAHRRAKDNRGHDKKTKTIVIILMVRLMDLIPHRELLIFEICFRDERKIRHGSFAI